MRFFLLGFLILCALVVGVAGRRGTMSRRPPIEVFPDMDRQPKLRPQTENAFFADGLSSRRPVEGTVSRGSHFLVEPMNTGQMAGSTNFVEVSPVKVTPQVMARGQQRFQINCQPCHGPLGDGNGVTRQFGMAVVGNFQDPRIVSMTDGELFYVITNGRNLMGPYGPNVVVEDRWAIIAYLRALQLARVGTTNDLPQAQRAALSK
jgi:mono/diheme cytochrome c family protein